MFWFGEDIIDDDEKGERQFSNWQLVRKVVPLFRPHWKQIALGAVLLVVSSGLGVLGPIVLKEVIDTAVNAAEEGTVDASRDAILQLGGLFLVVVIGAFTLEGILGIVATRVGVTMVVNLKERLFRHILDQDLRFFEKYPPGKLLARVEGDTEALKQLFSTVAMQLLRTGLVFAGVVGVMLYYDATTTLTVMAALPVFGVIAFVFVRLVRKVYREARKRYAALTGFLTEYISGVEVVQHYNYADKAKARLRTLNDRRLRMDVIGSFMNYGFWGLFALAEVGAIIVIVAVGARGVMEQTLTVGTLVMFLEFVRQLFMPLLMLSEFVNQVQQGLVAAERVFGIMMREAEAPDAPNARDEVPFNRAVAFENVRFSYDGKTDVLHDVSFTIEKGQSVALVGASGGGKSTLVNLLLRFYEPGAGRITVDGEDVRAFTRKAWRDRVGLVLQQVYLFPGTVRDNLAVLDESRSDEAIQRAARIVQADDIVAKLPTGYASELAERGANLSHGERQLISFARALVHDPALLVLDEATSAVDPITEQKIQRALDRLLEGRTALIVAHRLSTIRKCDLILVIKDGRIVERGTHDELFAQEDGVYRAQALLQFPELAARVAVTASAS